RSSTGSSRPKRQPATRGPRRCTRRSPRCRCGWRHWRRSIPRGSRPCSRPIPATKPHRAKPRARRRKRRRRDSGAARRAGDARSAPTPPLVLVLLVIALRQVEEAVRVRIVGRVLLLLFLRAREREVLKPGDGRRDLRLGGHAERLLGRDELAAFVVRHHHAVSRLLL